MEGSSSERERCHCHCVRRACGRHPCADLVGQSVMVDLDRIERLAREVELRAALRPFDTKEGQ